MTIGFHFFVEIRFHHAVSCVGDGVGTCVNSRFNRSVCFTARGNNRKVWVLFAYPFDEFNRIFTTADVKDINACINVGLKVSRFIDNGVDDWNIDAYLSYKNNGCLSTSLSSCL